ncbi:MAG: hypothetical protein KF777_17975 [Planctomycetaceae bacterium]|nr:hypothetical protein [Planctomycetaceae bacterium]
MISPAPETVSFSADVDLTLVVNGVSVRLSSVAPDLVIAREGVELEKGEGYILTEIDGEQFRRPVSLDHGAQPFSQEIAVRSLGRTERIPR